MMLDIPPEIARKVADDMQAYFEETDGHKRDAIAATTLSRLKPFVPRYGERLRLSGVKRLFRMMKEDE
jgi:hypothetical protein